MKRNTKRLVAYTSLTILILAALMCACSLNGETPPMAAPTPAQTPAEAPPEETPHQESEHAHEEEEPARDRVAIYLGNDLYALVPFDTEDIVTVDQGNGKVNEVTLTGHSVYMSHSTCDNQDCVKQGAITLENRETRILMDWVICLPNQVTIEFVPGDKQ